MAKQVERPKQLTPEPRFGKSWRSTANLDCLPGLINTVVFIILTRDDTGGYPG
jgi:hypothetical protein